MTVKWACRSGGEGKRRFFDREVVGCGSGDGKEHLVDQSVVNFDPFSIRD
ncbi:MAG: hypothetical protein UCH28_01110 [Adlercreutzia sp.]|nr:hypothetical protein [Adlercreutzia sp.]